MHVHEVESASETQLIRIARRVDELGSAIIRLCEQHRFWLLSLFTALYLLVTGLIAVRKQFENDELFTLNIARLPSLSDVWAALLTGAEQLPPFFYVLTRAVLSVFGTSNFTLRLPALLGVWVMSLCLFRFVRIRSSALYGLTAMLFVLTTGAYYYAFEARPYGLYRPRADWLAVTGRWQTASLVAGRAGPQSGGSDFLSLLRGSGAHSFCLW